METNSTEPTALEKILVSHGARSRMYQAGVQTTVFGKTACNWQHWLTKLDFICQNETLPETLVYEYPEVIVVRRLLSNDESSEWLKRLLTENLLDTGHETGCLQFQGRLSTGNDTWRPHSEWCQWPGHSFIVEPVMNQNFPGNTALVALDAPYYPSLDHVLSAFFNIRSQSWSNYFRGQVAVVIPDFRARISKLTIALSCLKADLECRFINPDELVVKAYAENSQGCILQKTIRLENSSLEVELPGMPSLASIVLMCSSTRETLDRRSFQANISWHEPGVLVDIPKDEIEQILLAGEGETIEFKEKLDKGRPERVARTVTAFANTKGGTIVFGVDDDHQIVGCPTQGMADTITNIVRSYCDPPPVFATTEVNHQGKSLLLLRVMESPESVHTVKDQGPFIRANGTNRAPTSYELEILFRRRSNSNPLTRVLYGS